MVRKFLELASIPWWDTKKPSSLLEDTLKTHFKIEHQTISRKAIKNVNQILKDQITLSTLNDDVIYMDLNGFSYMVFERRRGIIRRYGQTLTILNCGHLKQNFETVIISNKGVINCNVYF
jgi:hypothetical protein